MTHLELHLLATPKAAPELRHHLRDHPYDVRLCATELLTNVIDHVGEGTPVTVRVIGVPGHGHTRIEVSDPEAQALPVLLPATETEESGRGLALLDALSDRWGVNRALDHKTVWCEIRSMCPSETTMSGRGGRRRLQQAADEAESQVRQGRPGRRPRDPGVDR
ncbi:ATP-binding protein [Streptomyces sp. NPDC005917]|uniref:ATP-binding protein n=1 Tax=unclassified Streptomyces TaxID=2593676 RepID=UPI0033C8A0E9